MEQHRTAVRFDAGQNRRRSLLKNLIAAIPLLVLAVASVSAAAPKPSNQDLKRYCSGDAATFCSDVDPGGPEMNACFRKNMSKMSKGCRRAISSYNASIRK